MIGLRKAKSVEHVSKKLLLLVEDDKRQLARYEKIASSCYRVVTASSFMEAKQKLESLKIDILVTDIHLSTSLTNDRCEGFEIVDMAKNLRPKAIRIVMTSDPRIETYEAARQKGAQSFLKKPILNETELAQAIQCANRYHSNPVSQSDLDRLDKGMVFDKLTQKCALAVARSTTIPSVIYGETGTGKEEVAKLIHRYREKFEGSIPFISVNCANLDPSTVNSVIFGHKKGSFTGAIESSKGLVGEADGGILFLDEIHHLNHSTQTKLLRVLNDGKYQRLGEAKEYTSSFQVLAASTRNLDALVEEGSFLLDLRTRILGIEIHLKPLRERREEMAHLITTFFTSQQIAIEDKELSELIKTCKNYYWQGNIRLLFSILHSFYAMSLVDQSPLKAKNLPVVAPMLKPKSDIRHHVDSDQQELFESIDLEGSLRNNMEAVERFLITRAMRLTKTKTDAAAMLKMHRSTFDKRSSRYGL